MPVIIERADWKMWLGEVDGNPAALMRPAAEDLLRYLPADKKVGNVRNDGPDLLELVVASKPTLL